MKIVTLKWNYSQGSECKTLLISTTINGVRKLGLVGTPETEIYLCKLVGTYNSLTNWDHLKHKQGD